MNIERPAQSMCYMTNWSHKRPGTGKFVPEDIDPTLCTHIVYSFATLKNYLLAEENEKDGEMYERLMTLRNKNPDLKVSIPINLKIKKENIKESSIKLRNCHQHIYSFTWFDYFNHESSEITIFFRYYWRLVAGLSARPHSEN